MLWLVCVIDYAAYFGCCKRRCPLPGRVIYDWHHYLAFAIVFGPMAARGIRPCILDRKPRNRVDAYLEDSKTGGAS